MKIIHKIRSRLGDWQKRWQGFGFIQLIMIMCLLALGASRPATAQSIASSFAGFSAQKDQPVKIEADRLEVFDNRKKAIFTGNVKVTQGGLTMRSKRLEVTYHQNTGRNKSGKAGRKGPKGPNAAIKFIRASERVVIDTPDQQSVTSNWAEFDVNKQLITIGGNVVMSHGNNLLKGDKLVINLKDGTSRLDTRRIGGRINDKKQRVRMILTPGEIGKNIGKLPSFSGAVKPRSGGDRRDTNGQAKAEQPTGQRVEQSLPWVRRRLEEERQKKFGDAFGE